MEAMDYDQHNVYIVLELVKGGDLYHLIKSMSHSKRLFKEGCSVSHNKNVDWWSLGVLTYTLFYGFEPYSIADVIDNKLNRTLVQSIFNNNHANNASPVARDFILSCLNMIC
uniref:Aurora kinase n=1 Tax=Ditylenchus dipsaci TaxID=166011 RepID=A0A915DV74_9BILA